MIVATLGTMLVEKEEISKLKFSSEEVLCNPEDRKIRQMKLGRATFLGNVEHFKIHILFEDQEGLKIVYTTIWATSKKNIVLKLGVKIPICRIHDVILT